MTITLPVDFTESLEFRRLESICGSRSHGLCVFMSLFQNLGYLAREGSPVGRIAAADVLIFCKDLEPFGSQILDVTLLPADGAEKLFKNLCDTAKLLVKDGEDYYCPMFERYNRASSSMTTMNSFGGRARSYDKQVNKALAENLQGSLGLPAKWLVDEIGRPLDGEMVRRVCDLITRCDLALGKRTRPGPMYSESLIQNALSVCRGIPDADIAGICRIIVKHRASKGNAGHPALLGMTAEKLLPQFAGLKAMLGET